MWPAGFINHGTAGRLDSSTNNLLGNSDLLIATQKAVREYVNPPSVALAYNASLTPDCNDGLNRLITLSGDIELNPPTNPYDNLKWQGIFIADGANRNITLNASILIPSNFTTFLNPTEIQQDERWLVKLQYDLNTSSWWLIGWIGGFA